jgi:hypothetical protein
MRCDVSTDIGFKWAAQTPGTEFCAWMSILKWKIARIVGLAVGNRRPWRGASGSPGGQRVYERRCEDVDVQALVAKPAMEAFDLPVAMEAS